MNVPSDLIKALLAAKHVAVLTGAGVSAESGIPTFRDRLTGLWQQFRVEDLATPEAFLRDPALVWGWYEWRRQAVRKAEPNPGHRALAQMSTLVPQLTLITQNVDDLHERAGSKRVCHLHGQIERPYCESCRTVHDVVAEATGAADSEGRIEPPVCSLCGGRIRPGVVWFGESLPEEPWRGAVAASQACDVFLCVGTSAVVQPAASLINLAQAIGALTVQVNPNPTSADDVATHTLRGKAGEILPMLREAVWS